MGTKTATKFLDFTGGMQNATSRFMQKDTELDLGLNVHGDIVGSFMKRYGYKRAGTGAVETNKTPTIFYDGGTFLYTHYDTNIYYNASSSDPVAGAWSQCSGGTDPTATMYMSMARFQDIKALYIAGAITTPTEAASFLITQVVAVEPTAPQTKANADVTTFPRAKYVVRWRDRLYFGYCYATWVTEGALIKPSRIVYTEVPVQGALNAPAEDSRNVLDNTAFINFFDADDPVTGLMPTAESLVVFTREGLWKWNFSSWKKMYPVGCVAHRTIKTVDIYNFWLSKEGIMVESGGKPELISNKIQPIMDQITNPENCFAGVDDKHYYLYVGSLVLDGITYTNCVIQYSVRSNSFYIYKYTLPSTKVIKAAGEFDNSSIVRNYFGADNGQALYLSHPGDATKVYTDGDQTNETFDIEMKVQTKRWDFGIPQKKKKYYSFTVLSDYASNTAIKTRMEGSKWQRAGLIHQDIEDFEPKPPEGKDVQLEFAQTGQVQGPQINGVIFEVEQSEG